MPSWPKPVQKRVANPRRKILIIILLLFNRKKKLVQYIVRCIFVWIFYVRLELILLKNCKDRSTDFEVIEKGNTYNMRVQ